MQYILGALIWIIRRGPIGLGVLAVVLLGLGYYLQIGQNERNAQKLAAIEAGPPAVVDITKFDADRDVTDVKEVVVRAQAVMEDAYRLTLEKDGTDDFAFMVPLVSPTAASDRVLFGIALFTSSQFTEDDLTPELMTTGIVGFGDYGPIVEYNGRVSSLGQWDELVTESLQIEGLTLGANAVMVRPYLEGREAALTPSETTIFGLLSKVAGVLGLLALGKLVFSSKPDEATPTEIDMTEVETAQAPVPQASGVPLWKQRSGLVDASDYVDEPATFEPASFEAPADTTAHSATVQQPAIDTPKGGGFGIRKVLIGVVAALFVLGLVSTVWDLIAKSSPAQETVAVMSSTDIAAATAADLVVPDADPNRHWTDIDVTPIVEWVVAKALLAATGDTDAMMSLGMIIGAVIFTFIMIRYFFIMRRALRPRTTARFDSMGIN